ncbi:MAG: polysaccharide biosynthesis C-terminal domain-containing protein [Lachnospirales bacterium]
MNIKGAPISTMIVYFITCILNLISPKKHLKIRFNKRQILIKPLFASIVMTLVVKLTYVWLIDIVGAIIYFILLLFTKSLIYKDFSLLLGGKRIFNKLDKYKFIK